MLCTKIVYNYIDLGLMNICNIDLPIKVRINTKKKRTRKYKKVLGRSISERPSEINDRSKFGHWEIDSVAFKSATSCSKSATFSCSFNYYNII